MDEQDKSESGRLAEGNFQLTLHLSQERTLQVSGYLYAGESADERNARLDAAQDLIDRQFIRCDMVNKEAQRAAVKAGLEEYRENVDALSKRKEGKANGQSRLTSQELETLKMSEQTIRGMMLRLKSLDEAIIAGRKKLGTAAS